MKGSSYACIGVVSGSLALVAWILADKPKKSRDPEQAQAVVEAIQGRWILVETFGFNAFDPFRRIVNQPYPVPKYELWFRGLEGVYRRIPKDDRDTEPSYILWVQPNTSPVAFDYTRYHDRHIARTDPRYIGRAILKVENNKLYLALADHSVTKDPPKSFDIYNDRTVLNVLIFERPKGD